MATKRSLRSGILISTFWLVLLVFAFDEARLAIRFLTNDDGGASMEDRNDKDAYQQHPQEIIGESSSLALLQDGGNNRQNCMNNSQQWLTGTRLSNANDDLSEDYIQQLIEATSHHGGINEHVLKIVASPTICHADSNFTNPKSDHYYWDRNDQALEDEWHFRLLYMAIHHLFHAPAVDESRSRRRRGCTSPASSFDFECPTAKFYVAPYTKHGFGFGAAVRNAVVSLMIDAIAVGRVPIFLNNVNTTLHSDVDDKLQQPSMLASCDRRDLQCFFLPVTPCTVTVEQLQEIQSRKWGNMTTTDDDSNDERIWVVSQWNLEPYKEEAHKSSHLARQNLHDAALQIISTMKKSKEHDDDDDDDNKWKVLNQAALRILQPYLSTESSSYPGDGNTMVHAALMYFMRPNPRTHEYIQTAVDRILPQSRTMTERLLGVMIRRSDKCDVESECLSPTTYQEYVLDVRKDQRINNIILSSEDKSVLRYIVENNNTANDDINYYYNKDDASPGTGSAAEWEVNNIDPDSVTLSSLVVLKLQLHSNVVYGNCCSNFHQVLLDLYKHGCSRRQGGQHSECIQHHRKRKYHMCCYWSQSKECEAAVNTLAIKSLVRAGVLMTAQKTRSLNKTKQ